MVTGVGVVALLGIVFGLIPHCKRWENTVLMHAFNHNFILHFQSGGLLWKACSCLFVALFLVPWPVLQCPTEVYSIFAGRCHDAILVFFKLFVFLVLVYAMCAVWFGWRSVLVSLWTLFLPFWLLLPPMERGVPSSKANYVVTTTPYYNNDTAPCPVLHCL